MPVVAHLNREETENGQFEEKNVGNCRFKGGRKWAI